MTVTRTAQLKASNGADLVLPPGLVDEIFLFILQSPPVADSDGDGRVDHNDVSITLSDALVASVVPQLGAVTVIRTAANTSPTPFTVTCQSESSVTAKIRVTSDQDGSGFELTLPETSSGSGVFTGTFTTGTAIAGANAGSPSATSRPVIKAVDRGLVSEAYTDDVPLQIVSDAI